MIQEIYESQSIKFSVQHIPINIEINDIKSSTSLNLTDDDSQHLINYNSSMNLLSSTTPLNPIVSGGISLERTQTALSVRSSRSRRRHHLRRGSSADGRALSVIFMDNNQEYVNTGFAFAYNDEKEMSLRNRKVNPLIKAKSLDELYENKRRRRQERHRKTLSFVNRKHDSFTDYNKF